MIGSILIHIHVCFFSGVIFDVFLILLKYSCGNYCDKNWKMHTFQRVELAVEAGGIPQGLPMESQGCEVLEK